MKKDLNLVKHMLLDLQAQHDGETRANPIAWDQFDTKDIAGHTEWMTNAGLVKIKKDQDASKPNNVSTIPIKITPLGTEFVNYSKNDKVWEAVKSQVASKKVPFVLEQIKEALKVATMQGFNT